MDTLSKIRFRGSRSSIHAITMSLHSNCLRLITQSACHGRLFPVMRSAFVPMSTDVRQLLSTKHVGFLGSGQMAQAMVKGFLADGVLEGSQVSMTDRFGTSFPDAQKYGIEYVQQNDVMARKSDVIFACVKPNVILNVLKELGSLLEKKLIISVAAGTTLKQISEVVPSSTRIVRIMPNTPCLVRAGTAVYAGGSTASDEDIKITTTLGAGIFRVMESVPESLINVASGISGCGPAYMFLVTEALADGGVRMGLPRALAHKLAVSMMAGSAAMMEQTNEHPAVLRGNVCSPGGATIAAVHALEEGGVRAAFINAVRAAAERSEQLG